MHLPSTCRAATALLLFAAPASAQTSQSWEPTWSSRASGAGDVDADGFDDVLIGVGGPEQEARVFSGLDGSLIWNLPPTSNTVDYGEVLAPAGDVNADGHADVIVAGPGLYGSIFDSSILVHSGIDGSVLYEISGFALGLTGLGMSAAGVGDLDGDGHDDFALGSSPFGTPPNQAVVFSGATGDLLYRFANVGFYVAAAGDVDADGTPDILLSGTEVQVRSGRTGAVLFAGPGAPGPYADQIAGVGDVDGDGHADFALATNEAGQIYSGRTGTVLHEIERSALTGVAGVGDQDEDGAPDVAFWRTRASFLVSGRTGHVIAELDVAGVRPAGDVNADGRPDYVTWLDRDGDVTATVEASSLGRISYCRPAVRNSTGRRAITTADGSLRIADDDFRIRATSVPPGELGILMASRMSTYTPFPNGSAGILCVGMPTGFFTADATHADATGMIEVPVDLTALPAAIGGLAPGDSLHFQCWYRDGATSNYSSALKVYFN